MQIFNHSVYKSNKTKYAKQKTEFIYAEDATFEDPLICMYGKNAIAAMIHGIPLLVREHKVRTCKICHFCEYASDTLMYILV